MDLDYNDKAVSVFKGTRLHLKIIEKLAFEFAKIDVQALFKMSDAALQNHFSRAGLSFFERNDAMQAVLKARKSQYTWEGKRIEKKINVSPQHIYDRPFYTNHVLYKVFGVYEDSTMAQIQSALRKKKEMIAGLGVQYEKAFWRHYAVADLVFSSDVTKKAYDRSGDEWNHLPTNRKLAPGHRHLREEYTVIQQPPQPESPRTPVQHYRKPTYSPPPRTPAANNPAYKSAPGPSPEELVAKYARGLRFRQDNVREERRLHNLHQGIGRAY